jgi:hypothetical protein
MYHNLVGSDVIYYADAEVRITSKQALFSGQAYPLAGMRGARVISWPTGPIGIATISLVCFSCALVTLVVTLFGPPSERTLNGPGAYFAYLLLALGMGVPLVFVLRTKYIVQLDAPVGLLEALRTDDKGYAENVARTVNLAIEEHGTISTEQPTV